MGHVGSASRSVYCASKWAMEGMTKAMAIELGPHGIRVNTICPTFIETPLTTPYLADPAFRDHVLSKIELGRLGRVEDPHGRGRLPGERRLRAHDGIVSPRGWRVDGGMSEKLPPRTGRTATATDVARLAGVSQSAVSRTFTPGASVAPRTREKVIKAAKTLGYRPNLIARSLITRRSRIIGVAMGYLQNLLYPDVLEALSRRLQELDYHLLLFTAPPDGDADPVLEQVMQYQVDGLILASTTLSSALALSCRDAGIPVVLLNRTTTAASIESVTGSNRLGARTIAEFFVAGGHRRFAYVAGLENSSTNRDRERGFREGLASHGITQIQRVIGNYDWVQAGLAADQLFGGSRRPDAVFCAGDHMALAVLEAARHRHHLQVPEDVSIVGFDDVAPASWPSFGLTTFAQPVAAMVDAVVETIQNRLTDPSSSLRRVVVPGDLVVRQSARVPEVGLETVDGRQIWRMPPSPARKKSQ